MNTKRIAYLLVFLFVLASSGIAFGATDDTRYLVKSNSNFWKKSFGVRHQFEGGFTTDLSDWQLRVAKMFSIEVEPVKKLYVLADPEATLSPTDDTKVESTIKARPSPVVSARALPSVQVPWGIKAIHNDLTLTKTGGGVDVKVAVLDTGVLKTHPDLQRRIKECKDFTSAKKPIVDGSCDDKNGHGTHVSGIIAADGGEDALGIYGVAPEASIFAYKVCGNNGSCWSDDIADAMRTAADSGANIINLSLGSDSENSLIAGAISYAVDRHVLIVAAAGNDGPDIGSIDYPGANPDVVAVGAFDVERVIAEWSSRGNNSNTKAYVVEKGDIEFAAPGYIVESTWKDGGYVVLSGTSMATPHIAGLAALLWQSADLVNPASTTRELLHKFSEDMMPYGDDDASGFGFPHK